MTTLDIEVLDGYNGCHEPPVASQDILFKIVFGTQQNEAILRALLNAILDRSGRDRISQIVPLNPFNEKDYFDERGVILDVRAQDGQGRFYNVEVQLSREARYLDRTVYYVAQLLSSQLEKGEPYTRLAPTNLAGGFCLVCGPGRSA